MTKLTAVGGYIFAGGFTLGVKRAGFEVLAQLESGPYGVATTRRNHPGLPVHTDPATWPLEELRERGVDFVYGNPPCAPWSNAGTSPKKVGQMGDHWKRDPRTSCVTQLFRVLEVVRPTVWAWESVQPALRRGREMVDELTAIARGYGYGATYVLLNAVHLGVPQIRRRVFFIFHKVALDWEYPAPEARRVTTVREAWAPLLEGGVVDGSPLHTVTHKGHRDLVKLIPQGGSLLRTWQKLNPPETWVRNRLGNVTGRPRFLDTRLAWDAPCPTLTGGATKFHPELDRYITLKEQQLLCGYPVEYEFEGKTLGDKYAQTAQAVMPPVGEWLARNVYRAIEREAPADPAVARIVDLERDGERNEAITAAPGATAASLVSWPATGGAVIIVEPPAPDEPAVDRAVGWPARGAPGIVVNVRGCGGAGKSTLVRAFLEARAPFTAVTNERGKTRGYVVRGAQVIGPYWPSPIGAEATKEDELLRLVAERATVGNVLLEGKGLSAGTKVGLLWARELGSRVVFAFLRPPYDVCKARLLGRRAEKGTTREITERSWGQHQSQWARLEKHARLFAAAGARVVWLPWEDPLPALLELLPEQASTQDPEDPMTEDHELIADPSAALSDAPINEDPALGNKVAPASGTETPTSAQVIDLMAAVKAALATKTGPTALARDMIARGALDEEILRATAAAFGPGAARPLKFTRHDLKRLRAKVTR